ncbi:hypothetical protein glysoja_006636 [Glycine soja]|nr:hypothetical protein glysoja_006636 [Glycine soja]
MEMSINWSSISPNIRETQGPNIPAVDIAGTARVMWWDHNFKVHVDSHVTVDPVFLDVIDQENTSELEVFTARPRGVTLWSTWTAMLPLIPCSSTSLIRKTPPSLKSSPRDLGE